MPDKVRQSYIYLHPHLSKGSPDYCHSETHVTGLETEV
jgi:hypothetical protein